ncbi:hypothetical protein GCM10011507_13250 [Edaphobacter acidisoli]|uniref:Alpha-L-rhamnosidase six-hairpin glycosidase domain-containing protein n=1 Tax=Edaphobacter acidisoli TaxID=2040573 RepID=A0A916RQC6_9BACT|nr:hypothetical protein [Edaphobacter acidisoli]GGA62997.1 hypothetical protein GCM10011507_13250 [Edaphobacter acidisoli]
MLKIIAAGYILAASTLALGAATLESSAGSVRMVVELGPSPIERVEIKVDGQWVPALFSAQAATRVVTLGTPNTPHSCVLQTEDVIPNGILLRGDCGIGKFEQRIHLTPEPDELNVTVRFMPESGVRINSVEDRYDFAPGRRAADDPEGPVDFVWSQNIKNEADDDIPSWSFKSPVVMLQQGPVFAALMPKLSERLSVPLALDLDVTSQKLPWLAYGAIPSQPYGHSYFRRSTTGEPKVIETSTPVGQEGVIEYRYSIVASQQPSKLGYRRAVRLLWQQQGREELLSSYDAQRNVTRPWLVTFQDWSTDTWLRYADEVYRGFPCGSKQCGTLASFRNPGGHWEQQTGPDAWFNPWFETLRTAYGWYLYGRRTDNADIQHKAESVLNLVLSSPRDGGAFSTIYLVDSKQWLHSDGWAGYGDDYHAFGMSWTGYWMLKWGKDLTPDREQEIVAFLRPFGDFLVKQQLASGVIPAWYDSDLKPREEFRDFNAETAASGLFLASLAEATGDHDYLAAARKTMDFVTREVLPRQRWFDFETFLSCARKPFDFYDPWTAQYPQNNLSQIQAAAAYLKLYQITKEQEYLTTGTHVLDYLLLTQQVWNNPAFSPKLVGGFTTQNTDAEWSDAREAYAAVLLWHYYQATGNQEYLERAVGAARSTFAIAPWENWAHTGFTDESGALTGFHWGPGSGMTSVEMMHPMLGDAYIDLSNDAGVCFNACSIRDLRIRGDHIFFNLDAVSSLGKINIHFAGANEAATYQIIWNGNQSDMIAGKSIVQNGFAVSLTTDKKK